MDMQLSEYLIDCFSGGGCLGENACRIHQRQNSLNGRGKDDLNIDKTEPTAPLVKEEDDSSSRRNLATLKKEREQRCALMRMRINLTIND